jgi:hypothetical protein
MTSEHDVIGLVREYLSEWLPEELSRFPIDCRPGRVRDGEDLNELAYQLALAYVSSEGSTNHIPGVEEMDGFLTEALRRISEIRRADEAVLQTTRD